MTKYFITCPDGWSTIDWAEAGSISGVVMGGDDVLYVGTDADRLPWFWDEVHGCTHIGYWGDYSARPGMVWIYKRDPRYDTISAFHLSCLHGKPEVEFLRRAVEWQPEHAAFVR